MSLSHHTHTQKTFHSRYVSLALFWFLHFWTIFEKCVVLGSLSLKREQALCVCALTCFFLYFSLKQRSCILLCFSPFLGKTERTTSVGLMNFYDQSNHINQLCRHSSLERLVLSPLAPTAICGLLLCAETADRLALFVTGLDCDDSERQASWWTPSPPAPLPPLHSHPHLPIHLQARCLEQAHQWMAYT